MSPKRKHADKNSRDALNGTAASPRKKRARLETRGKEHDSSPAKPDTTTASTTAMYQFPSKRDPVVLSPSSPGPSKHALRTTANMNTNGGPKRMLVKNLKIARKVDPKVYLDQTWDKLQAALDTVFAGGKIDFSLEELYRGVENLCRQKMAKDVYDRLEKTCKEHIAGLRKQVEQTAARPDVTNVDVLRATLQVWEEWMKQVVGLFHPISLGGL
jgi:cullin-4